MNFNCNELVAAGWISILYLLIFGLAVWVRYRFPSRGELSRKTSHMLSGLCSLSFPWLIHDARIIGLMCLLFLGFLILSKKLGKLQAVHGVKRESYGAYLFPVAVFLIYLISAGKPHLYFVSILVLSISDTAAALIGSRYGSIKIPVEGNLKSLEGSMAFVIVTFLCVEIPLLLMTNMDRLHIILISAIVALLVTGFELIALNGTDNLFIPLGVFYIIDRLSHYPSTVDWITLIQLVVSFGLIFILTLKTRAVRIGWKITMALFLFASFALGNFWWLATAVFCVLLSAILFYFSKHIALQKAEVSSALKTSVIPVIPIFISAALNNYQLLYPVYLAALCSEGILFTYDFLGRQNSLQSREAFFLKLFSAVLYPCLIIFIPTVFYAEARPVCSTLLFSSVGILVSYIIFQAMNHLSSNKQDSPTLAWMESRNLASGLGCVATFILTTIFK